MSDRDALVLTLVRGLEHAATALDVVNEATRRDIGALLSPKARRLLAALSAPTDAAAPRGDAAEAIEEPKPSIKTMKEIIRSAGLATADLFDRADIEARYAEAMARLDEAERLKAQPKKRRHIAESSDDDDARPRTASGLQAFPEDVLGAIIAFVDLPMRFTCVVACRALRDAAAKLSPRLEHALVLKKFPLLRPVVESPQGAPAPRDLFRTFSGFGGERPPGPEPTETLDAYTLLLELYVVNNHSDEKKSVFVGTATLAPEAATHTPSFNFTIPGSVWEEVDDLTNGAWNLKARVVAMRRVGGRLQFADLFCGGVDDWEDDGCVFEYLHMPSNYENKGLDWQIRQNDAHDMYCQPELRLYWNCEPDRFSVRMSRLEVLFAFWTENGTEEMSLTDACLCLEHYVEWSE